MEKKVFIGIDFSKLTLDVTFFVGKDIQAKHYKQFSNDKKGCLEIVKWIKKVNKDYSSWLFCGEFTGIYTMTLVLVLKGLKLDLWLENPMQIKLSNGLSRDKNDKVDSFQISRYAYRFRDRIKLHEHKDSISIEIRELVRFKDRLTKQKSQLFVPAKESKRVLKEFEVTGYIFEQTEKQIKGMNQLIKDVDKRILAIIKADTELKNLYDLITSVVGVGMQTAIYLLLHTSGFTSFEKPRQLACYCGVAPFSKRSGTSVRGKSQVSHIANKKLKTLLHMCALNAIKYDPILKKYYERKVAEGKHKMSVLNVVRNKLLYFIWAVVKSGNKYDKKYTFDKRQNNENKIEIPNINSKAA
jgi:transposase